MIGAGWAGCAAAVTLAERGCRVTLIETGAVLGGRARRVERAGLPLDNGQHLLLGAYTRTQRLLRTVHGTEAIPLERRALTLAPLAPAEALALRARALPAPFGLAAGLLFARGLSVRDKLGTLRWFDRLARGGFRCPPDQTVAQLVASGPAATAHKLWEPLCIAALNTPMARASAQVFANVLKAAFAAGADASDFLVARTDLGALFPDAAARFVVARGGEVRPGSRAEVLGLDAEGALVGFGDDRERFDAAVLAVGPHQLARAVAPAVVQAIAPLRAALAAAAGLTYEPIATAWLGYASGGSLTAPIVRLDDAPGQWAFDRPDIAARARPAVTRPALAQVIAVVVSASDPHEACSAPELAQACDAQLRRLRPGLPPLAWSQAITERRATYACTPDRPHAPTTHPHPRLALAGDWLDPEFPATLEAAVRTGVAAADALAAK